jgi:membrane-associated phospholipid phosphatase
MAAAAAYVVLIVAVLAGATTELDRKAAEWFRPDGAWGMAQVRLGPFIDRLEPPRAYLFLGLVTVLVSLGRRSWRPMLFAGLVAGTSIGVTTVTKVSMHRSDPTGDIASTGGSFPSGHIVALTVCLGCCALLVFRRTRWWHWVLVAVPPAVMAAALLYTAAHWVTDVVGGLLLALATICWAASWPLRIAMNEPRRGVRAETGGRAGTAAGRP